MTSLDIKPKILKEPSIFKNFESKLFDDKLASKLFDTPKILKDHAS